MAFECVFKTFYMKLEAYLVVNSFTSVLCQNEWL